MVITDVELLEIFVVSVPCNQESLFSIRKSFENDTDYEEFKKSLKEADEEEIKMMRKIKAGITDVSMGHYHTVEMDEMVMVLQHTHLICQTMHIKSWLV